jgi:hypothetical protein
MIYAVYEKIRHTELVKLVKHETDRATAERWVDTQQNLWGEDRAYKIVESNNSQGEHKHADHTA